MKIVMKFGGTSVGTGRNIRYYRLAANIPGFVGQNKFSFLWFSVPHLLLFLMILASIFLYFRQNRFALRMYYFEFILRILFFSNTFGFLLRLNIIFNNQMAYNALAITAVALELVRLITTIFLDFNWKKA